MLMICVLAGENVVRGDKESIKNLLEIFDGLLEYLNEEINEDSQNDGRHLHHTFASFNHLIQHNIHFRPKKGTQ